MASYVPGQSPLQNALMKLGAAPDQPNPKSAKDSFDDIARQTSVPANVLIALDEATGGKGSVEDAQRNAAAIAEAVAGGAKIEDAISRFAGDETRGRAILERSYDIADQMYSTGEAPAQLTGQDGKLSAGETAGGLARDVATGAVRGVGSAAQAMGVAADEILRYGDEDGTSKPTMLRGAGKAAGDAITAVGDKIAASRSQDYQDRREGTQISGDLTDPGSWSLGEDPSLIGLLGVAAEGIGSMAPIVAMPGARSAAVFGGLMAGGEGAQNGRQFVEDAAKTLDEDGRPEIEKLPAYRDLVAGGMAPGDAVEEVARRAENNAGFRQGLIGSIGGAATNRIMRGAEGWLGQGGRLTRAVKKGAAGALEEGAQEAAEGAAAATGINEGTGADIDVMAQSFGDFVGGALAGGGMGAVAGAALPGERPEPGPELGAAPDAGGPLALPAPGETLALPSPTDGGTIFGRDERPIPMPGPDGSSSGTAAAPPDQSSLGQDAAAPIQAGDVLPPPAGPLQAIAQGLDASAPAPEAPSMFPDQKPGGGVRLGDPATGAIAEAVFMGETPEGSAQVRINGQVIDMDPAEFDQARNAVTAIEEARKVAEKAVKQAATKAPAKPGALSQAAMQSIAPPAQIGPLVSAEEEMASMSPDDARKALANLEGLARQRGWNTRMTRMRDILQLRIAEGEPDDVQPGIAYDRPADADTGAVDEPAGRGKNASPDGRDQQVGGPAGQGLDKAGPAEGSSVQPAVDRPVGDLDVADGARKLRDALTAARGAGQVTHTTKKGKAKTGYVLKGVTKAEADAIDAYSFRKDGGIFVNASRADDWAPRPALVKKQETPAVADAAREAAPEPTDAQKDAGNYKMGHARWNGLNLSIENAKGSERRGKGPDGKEWSVTMPADYGYFRGTEGADGDHVDFYHGGVDSSDYVMIVDQVDAETGKFDEHKVIIGTTARGAALDLYRKGFSDGKADNRIGAITETTVDGMKAWLGGGRMRRPAAGKLDYPFKNDARKDAAPEPKPLPKPSERAEMMAEAMGLQDPYSAGRIQEEADSEGWENLAFQFKIEKAGGRHSYAWTDAHGKIIARMKGVGMPKTVKDGRYRDVLSAAIPVAEARFRPTEAFRKAWEAPGEIRAPQKNSGNRTQEAAPARDPQPERVDQEPVKKPAGILGALSQEKQDRAAELKARLAAKARGQASSGLDPEYITLGGELVALYIEAGTKRFGQMLRDFAESTGLTLREAQAPMRAAYNHVRDDMDLNGQDVSDMDDAAAVMAEVRTALAEAEAAASQSDTEGDNIKAKPADETTDDHQPDERDAGTSPGRDAEAAETRPDRVGGSRQGSGEADSGDAGPRRQDRGTGRPGSRRPAGDGAGRRAGGTDIAVERPGARNHVIPEGGLALPGGDKTRARNAVKAIETLRTLEREGRPATAEERQALSLYGGAGTLAPALPNSQGKIRFPDIAADLDRLLTDEERATVEKTSQYAFYTAEPVLRNMWNLAMQLGITGGQVFEPGMGVGGFAGTMPKGFFGEYTGIELDHITAKIAAALYPKHHIKHGDFIKTPMINDYYDLAIGNPPFARTQIKADPAYQQGFMIHDYFFAKSLDGVRPGGLLMFVTSAGTLNKLDSKARDYMADRADLVGAIRLPNTAFAENGTQVTTDIIVLRKRREGEAEANPAWRESTPISVSDKDGNTVELPVNRYFQDHPEMILGEQGAFDTLVGRSRIGVRPREGSDLSADLAAAVARFPRKITSMGDPVQMMKGRRDANSGETKAGSYYLKDGEIWQFDGAEGKAVPRRGKGQSGLSKADYDLIQDLIPMRDALRAVYAADLKGEDAKKARGSLNKVYDDFVAKRGPINKVDRTYRRPSAVQMEGLRQQAAEDARAAGAAFDIGSFDAGPMIEEGKTLAQIARARREAQEQPGYQEGDFDPAGVPDLVIEKFPNIDAFSDDPENFRLRAIERFDAETQTATKSRVFTENAINMSVRPTINSPEDALLHLLAETGRVDLDRIAELSKSAPARVREELEGKIFENPATEQFETRAKYLSGNVRRKLREAEAAMRKDDRFKANADALAAVLPDPIPRSQIVVPLGAHWFDQTLYSDFAKAKGLRLTAEFKPTLGIWVVDGDKGSSEARNAWGTEDMPFADLMRRVMNNKALRVTRTVKNADGTTNTFVDEEATQAAADKAQEVKAAFQEWLWSDEDRANALEEQYNDTFNSEVAPNYDGAYLTTPGVHSDWRWRPHQTAVIARILQDGSTYMAHTVGAGKTSAMIGAGMEARRLGLARKPWYVVPNHMLVQFATEFQHQYPLADILVADEKRFHTDRRKQFVADAATGEFDAVIITHSAFEKIPASEQAKGRVVSGILDDIREMVDSAGDTGDRGRDAGQQQATLGALNSIAAQLGIKVEKEKGVSTAKKIAQILEQAEQRLSKLTSDTRKDAVFDFDEIGVDMLFVDEAHLFRKLSFATTNGNIKGIDPSGSQASMDLFIKSRVVDDRNPGRGLVLASGTPITNTMAELYTLSRLMQPRALAERNISAFDAWAATFGEVASELEQTPDGGYKEVSRFSKFVNTPELSLMVRQIMDVVTSADLEKYVTRPKLNGGGRSLVVVESTEEQQAFQQTLAARMRAIAQRKGPVQKGDDILLSVINDGRLAAIDMRLVDPSSDGAGSKLERMIGNIYQRWKGGAEAPLYGVKKGGGYTERPQMRGPSTQIVFSTLGIEASKHNPDFSVHRYIKAELVRRGVPADQIVLAKDLKSHAQKQRAFNDMNEGKKRILVGSKSIFTGVNAQKRIAALHNLDPLWYPADDEQRNGRGLRQGNMNPEIEILDYSTKGTYDATMWQMMARKASFIEAFYRGDPTQRDMEDLGEASQFEQAKAMTTRDPRVLELTDMKAERDKLRRRAGAVDTQRARLRGEIRRSLREMEFYDEKIERTEALATNLPDLSGDRFKITIGRQTFDSRSDAGKALIQIAEELTEAGESVSGRRVGNIGGFAIEAHHRLADSSTAFSVRFDGDTDSDAGWSDDPVGLTRKLEHAMRAPERRLDFYRSERARLEKGADAARKSLEGVKDFAQADELAQMDERIAAIEAELLADSEKEQDAAKESRFGDDRPVVATLTGDELGEWSDIRDLRIKAQAWYRDNLQGNTIVNGATGWEIRLTRAAKGKMGGKGQFLLKSVPALQEIIAGAEKIGQSPELKGRDHIKAYHYLRARVEIGGEVRNLIVTIREMDDGRKFYDLNMDNLVGTRTSGPMDAREARVEPDVEIGADTLNIRVEREEINSDPQMTPARARAINAAARDELAKVGIAGRVRAEAGGEGRSAGTYQGGVIRLLRDRGAGWRHTLDHEIIHALRDASLWGRDHGIFTAEEWRALARAARADRDTRSRVEATYPDLSTAGQTEEMVAELYADWAQGRRERPRGALALAFGRIRSFFRAVASALRGEGFHDAAGIMERIASGEIGGRGPDGPGGGRGTLREQRQTASAAFQKWFGDSKVVNPDGSPMVVHHGTDAQFDQFDGDIFFFADRDTADDYATEKSGVLGGGNIISAYIRIENPAHDADVYDAAGIEGADREETPVFEHIDGDVITALKKKGFDGIILEGDASPSNPGEFIRSYAVFDPSQVKSVENSGQWDRNDPRMKEQRDMERLRVAMQSGRAKAAGLVSREFWQKSPEMFSNWLTDAMGRNSRFNILGAVPGHPLFAELGKNLSAAQTYLRNKQEMDAMRNDWQARASDMVDRWTKTGRKNTEANNALMDLMHKTTLAGIDPTKPNDWKHTHQTSAARILKDGRASEDRKAWAKKVMDEIATQGDSYAKLRAAYEAMPKEFRVLYQKVRDEYGAMADAMDSALIKNIETASRIAGKRAERRHRQEMNRIRDEGLEGAERDEAIDKADAALAAAQKRAAAGKGARMAQMRAAFESNRMSGPYFPLARFGNYFVTIRDADGKVVSFSRFEKKAQQDAFVREAGDNLGQVERGVLGEGADLRGMVDPRFVADVEQIMGEAGASPEVLDAVWQHWLETLPDQSVRKSQIHRKGRAGFNSDAIRAYSSAMFHGAHQLARLKYGLEMDENLNDAEEQAARQANPERAGFVVREMRQRHAFTMQPTNNPLVTAGTSLAFIWYLGMSPASAMVNLTQTTIVGVPMMAARFKKAGVSGSADALWKAVQDFGRGKGHIDKAPNLTADERAALAEGYRRGTIDKTQAHDLASVAESGVEYNPAREKAMRVIGFLFHHTERFNREVTFLANYRLLRSEGKNRAEAIDEADALVKKIHFDYQNTARPRVMQGDAAKLLLVFRNFTVNMLYRLFRDTHQAFQGDGKEAQAEARNQLAGVTLSMMAHAGIKGVWGYGLLMGLLGMFYPGGDGDDLEEWLQDALLMEGDSPGTAAWNWTMGMALNGVPGNVLGVSLTNRIGMPNLWFQPARAGTEGRDLWTHYLEQVAGPVAAIPGSFLSGLSMISDAWGEGNGDNFMRGAEKMMPGFAADALKPIHMMTFGANTYYGDSLIENVSILDAFRSALGFTPAKLAERYEINNRLKAKEKEIMGRRSGIHRAIGKAVMAGEDVPESVMRDLREFNSEFPEYPITPDTVRASVRGRMRMKERNEFGVSLNPKLNDRLRAESPPAIYG